MEKYVAVDGKRVAALDLSFNLGMDSIRNSRAIPVVERLHTLGPGLTGVTLGKQSFGNSDVYFDHV